MMKLQAARRAAFFAASILFCFLIWIPDNVQASREYKTILFIHYIAIQMEWNETSSYNPLSQTEIIPENKKKWMREYPWNYH